MHEDAYVVIHHALQYIPRHSDSAPVCGSVQGPLHPSLSIFFVCVKGGPHSDAIASIIGTVIVLLCSQINEYHCFILEFIYFQYGYSIGNDGMSAGLKSANIFQLLISRLMLWHYWLMLGMFELSYVCCFKTLSGQDIMLYTETITIHNHWLVPMALDWNTTTQLELVPMTLQWNTTIQLVCTNDLTEKHYYTTGLYQWPYNETTSLLACTNDLIMKLHYYWLVPMTL